MNCFIACLSRVPTKVQFAHPVLEGQLEKTNFSRPYRDDEHSNQLMFKDLMVKIFDQFMYNNFVMKIFVQFMHRNFVKHFFDFAVVHLEIRLRKVRDENIVVESIVVDRISEAPKLQELIFNEKFKVVKLVKCQTAMRILLSHLVLWSSALRILPFRAGARSCGTYFSELEEIQNQHL